MKKTFLLFLVLAITASPIFSANYAEEQENLDLLLDEIIERIEEIDEEILPARIEKVEEKIKDKESYMDNLYGRLDKASESKKDVWEKSIEFQFMLLDLLNGYKEDGLTQNTQAGKDVKNNLLDNLKGWAENPVLGWGDSGLETLSLLAGVYFAVCEKKTLLDVWDFADNNREKGITQEEYNRLIGEYEKKQEEGGNDPSPWHNNSLTFGYEDNVYRKLLDISIQYYRKYPNERIWNNLVQEDGTMPGDNHWGFGLNTESRIDVLESCGKVLYYHNGKVYDLAHFPFGGSDEFGARYYLTEGDYIVTTKRSHVRLRWVNNGKEERIYIFPNSTCSFSHAKIKPEKGMFRIIGDKLKTLITGEEEFEIEPPGSNCCIRGTDFIINIDEEGNTSYYVQSGIIAVRGTALDHEIELAAGQSVKVTADGTLGEVDEMETSDFELFTLFPVVTYDYSPAEYIYTVSHDGKLIKSELQTGTEIWSSSAHGSWVAALCRDPEGNIYTAGGDNKVRKFDAESGDVIWENRNTQALNDVDSDQDGNIYTGGSKYILKKISPEGNDMWSCRTGDVISTVTVDYFGDVYSGTLGGSIYKLDPEGKLIWVYEAVHILEIAVDLSGSVYAAGGNGNGVIKLSSEGELLWQYTDHPVNITYVAVGSLGEVYFSDIDGTISELDPETGELVAEFSGLGDVLYGFEPDRNGYIYVGTKNGDLYCVDFEEGTIIWDRHMHSAHIREVLLGGNGDIGAPPIQGTEPEPLVEEPIDVPEVTYAVGDTGPAGGIIVYENPDSTSNWQYIEAAPVGWAETDEDPKYHWGGRGILLDYIRAEELGAGYDNTGKIIEALSSVETEPYAAEVCDSLELGGFDDWYLPSRDELSEMYAELYQNGLGGLERSSYLSSTEQSKNNARTFSMNDGKNHLASKSSNIYVRPVRRF